MRPRSAAPIPPLLLAANTAALATLIPVALYQTGLRPTLPDPPFPIFDSERITTSRTAHPFGIPDSLLGLANFTATLILIPFVRRSPLARNLLGYKLLLDATAAGFNAARQPLLFRKLCSWCTATALATAVSAIAGRRLIAASLHR